MRHRGGASGVVFVMVAEQKRVKLAPFKPILQRAGRMRSSRVHKDAAHIPRGYLVTGGGEAAENELGRAAMVFDRQIHPTILPSSARTSHQPRSNLEADDPFGGGIDLIRKDAIRRRPVQHSGDHRSRQLCVLDGDQVSAGCDEVDRTISRGDRVNRDGAPQVVGRDDAVEVKLTPK
jgi:hypothetical protein